MVESERLSRCLYRQTGCPIVGGEDAACGHPTCGSGLWRVRSDSATPVQRIRDCFVFALVRRNNAIVGPVAGAAVLRALDLTPNPPTHAAAQPIRIPGAFLGVSGSRATIRGDRLGS
jgi:hypothetical protein